MEKLRGDVVTMIRGCLISNKSKMTLQQLNRDYRMLCGDHIPYVKLGFKRLDEFIQSEPSLRLINAGNEFYVEAEVSGKSLHIQEMVNRQKTSKKPVARKVVRFNQSNNRNQQPPKMNRWRPNNRFKTNIENSPRLAAVSHNQFVNRPQRQVLQQQHPQQQQYQPQQQQQHNQNHHGESMQSRLQKKRPEPLVLNQAPSPTTPPPPSSQNGATPRPKHSPIVWDLTPTPESCSSLTSVKRRLNKKMSQMTVDTDSGIGSPTADKPAEAQFKRTDDPCADLRRFAEQHAGLGQVDVSFREVQAKKLAQRFFTCKIQVGKSSYYTYPEEFKSQAEAERFCADKALTDLIPKYSKRRSLLQSNYMDILERVPPMLEKHQHGIWAWQLELDYSDKYDEMLPSDWLKVIDSSPCIQLEKCGDNCVLRHCKPGDVLQKGQKWDASMTISDVSVPSNTVQFSEEERLTAQITYVVSANEIWCRQCDTPEFERYNDMSLMMQSYYSKFGNTLHVTNVNVGRYYVALHDGEWYRIRAVDIGDDGVSCFFIDYGDESILTTDCLYQLKREFAICQAQAFVCRLAGLEELYEASINSEILQSIMSKQVLIELAADVTDENIDDLSTPVYMYDLETGNSINQILIPSLTIESASPSLSKDLINNVYVTNLESNGDIYVQIHSRGYEYLQSLLSTLQKQIAQKPPRHMLEPINKQNCKDRLFLIQEPSGPNWHRVKVIDWAPQGTYAQIYFIDKGNAEVIDVSKVTMYPLDKLSDVLSQYPAQAVKVKMALDIVPVNFVDLAGKMLTSKQPILVKVLRHDEEDVPIVEMFKRSDEDLLFCVNRSIDIHFACQQGEENNNNNKVKRKITTFAGVGKTVPSGGTLPRPPLPDKGCYFKVRVSFAVNPWNFFVQPLDTQEQLQTLMTKLQARYKDVLYSPLQTEDIVPGEIYASKHEDGHWYRTSVMKVIHKGSISVFYCDFGYYSNLTVSQLIPLDREFLELPFQALKAKLAGVKPKQDKWTVEDCDYFKKRVDKQRLYSVLKDIEKDELYYQDIVLELILIDTSGTDDIYIAKDLVSKNIAIDVSQV